MKSLLTSVAVVFCLLAIQPPLAKAAGAPAADEQPKTAKPQESFTSEIRPDTVWESSNGRILTILERKGDAFRGRFEHGKNVVEEVSGTIKDNKISWLYKDAGPDPANPAGAFGVVSDGKIDFTWRNEKGETGKFTLVHGFVDRTFHGPGGKTLLYKFYLPEHYDKTKHYPVVLFLHGYDPHPIAERWPRVNGRLFRFITPQEQAKNPSIVIAPLSPSGGWLGVDLDKPTRPLSKNPSENIELALGVLDEVMKSHCVDASRVYLMGYSNGAYAVWDLLARFPNRWAAAIPVSGGGDPSRIAAAKNVPIWATHGTADKTVSVECSRVLIAALRAAGGHPKFSEYPGKDHTDGIDIACGDAEITAWLFEQHLRK